MRQRRTETGRRAGPIGNNRRLKWLLGLEFGAIIFVTLVLAVLFLGSRYVRTGPVVNSLEGNTALVTLGASPIVISPSGITPGSTESLSAPTVPRTIIHFDPSSTNRVAPADVLQEIDFYPGGNGVGCPQNSTGKPLWAESEDEHASRSAEWFSPVAIMSCGWQPGETLSIAITHQHSIYWSGTIQSSANEGSAGSALLIFPVSSTMEPGTYYLSLRSLTDQLVATLDIYVPSTPRLYSVGETELAVYNFVPGESIRLFAYELVYEPETHIRLAGWNEYRVEATSPLIFKVSNVDQRIVYYVVGSISGLVEDSAHYGWEPGRPILTAPCGGIVAHLSLHDSASTSAAEGATAYLRSEPGLSAEILSQLSPGVQVYIVEGPVCRENILWWGVYSDNGQYGWIGEYQDGVYLLEPQAAP